MIVFRPFAAVLRPYSKRSPGSTSVVSLSVHLTVTGRCSLVGRCLLRKQRSASGTVSSWKKYVPSSADSKRTSCQLLEKEWTLNTGTLSPGGLPRIFSSPEPKAQSRAYSISVEPASVCVCVCVCVSVCLSVTFSNLNISATSGPIVTKFYLKHHWGG